MRAQPFVALVVVQFAFAFHKIFAKLVLDDHVPPATVAGLRVFFSALLLCILAIPSFPKRVERRDVWTLLGLGLIGAAANQWFFAEGLSRTTVVDTALLTTLTPVFALVFAVLLGMERFDKVRGVGVLLGLAGAWVLLGVEKFGSGQALGNFLIVLNTLTYGLYLVASRGVLQRLPTAFVAAGTFVAGSLFITPIAMPGLVEVSQGDGLRALALWGFVGVVGTTMVAYALNNYALKRLQAGTVAVFIFLQPVLGVILAVVLRGEEFTPRAGLAGLLILAGVALVVYRAAKSRTETPVTAVRAEAET